MNWISFAWTTPALLAGRKTRTRRDWSNSHVLKFHAGNLVAAYDKSPRIRGRKVAIIRLTFDPFQTNTAHLNDKDWELEGFAYLSAIDAKVNGMTPSTFWLAWKAAKLNLWTIDFELVRRL